MPDIEIMSKRCLFQPPHRLAGVLVLLACLLLQGASAKPPEMQRYWWFAAYYEKKVWPCTRAVIVENVVKGLVGSPGALEADHRKKFEAEYKKKTSNSSYSMHLVPASENAIAFTYVIPHYNGVTDAVGVARGRTPEQAERNIAAVLKSAGGKNPQVFRRWPTAADMNAPIE